MTKIYDSGFRGDCMLEDTEQINCISWLDYNYPEIAPLLFHVVNESMMPVNGRVKAKKKGLRAGVPDMVFLYKVAGYSGLIIELKRKDRTKSPIRKTQKEYLARFSGQGFATAICYGADQFKLCIKEYLQSKPK